MVNACQWIVFLCMLDQCSQKEQSVAIERETAITNHSKQLELDLTSANWRVLGQPHFPYIFDFAILFPLPLPVKSVNEINKVS